MYWKEYVTYNNSLRVTIHPVRVELPIHWITRKGVARLDIPGGSPALAVLIEAKFLNGVVLEVMGCRNGLEAQRTYLRRIFKGWVKPSPGRKWNCCWRHGLFLVDICNC